VPRPQPNVWLGASVENQECADERIPLLLQTPAAIRFLSCEPLLGPVSLSHMNSKRGYFANVPELESGGKVYPKRADIDWVIIGGESGARARPCDVAWIRSLVQQCQAAGVACFVKQLGSKPIDKEYFAEASAMFESQWGFKPGLKNQIEECTFRPNDKKGGDLSEWPEHLRVRQFPEVRAST
jgi:protein gp37